MARICAACDSSDTYVRSNGIAQWYRWDNEFLCQSCYMYYVLSPIWNPINNPINNPRRIKFKGKQILIEDNPRKGICSKCDKKIGDVYINSKNQIAIVKGTDMHHKRYDESNPLKYTQELCDSCHLRLRNMY